MRPDTVARSLAIGNPADGDLAVEAARASGGAVHAVPEEDVGENMRLARRDDRRVRRDGGRRSRSARSARRSRSGEVGADDRVVLLVTGDGLKTPEPVAGRLRPIEIDAGRDALLDRLGAAA